jgi:pimeloyl-[acyl-carrier protein] methyl ester esterase
MHGSTALMDDFVASAPRDTRVDLAALPTHLADYSELAAHFGNALRLTPDSILIAESFSGPLAIMLAERFAARALILCNTFVKAPYYRALGLFPLALVARVPSPAFLLRYFIVGARAPDAVVNQVRRAVATVPAKVMAERARSALRVDATLELARCTCPILYLRGTEDHVIREWSVDAVTRAATVPVAVARIAGPHLLLKMSPRESWSAIETFLDGASTG